MVVVYYSTLNLCPLSSTKAKSFSIEEGIWPVSLDEAFCVLVELRLGLGSDGTGPHNALLRSRSSLTSAPQQVNVVLVLSGREPNKILERAHSCFNDSLLPSLSLSLFVFLSCCLFILRLR